MMNMRIWHTGSTMAEVGTRTSPRPAQQTYLRTITTCSIPMIRCAHEGKNLLAAWM